MARVDNGFSRGSWRGTVAVSKGIPGERDTVCGRFTLTSTPEALAERFGIEPPTSLVPHYNIAPTQDVLAIRWDPKAGRGASFLRWGLIPPWAPDPSVAARMINARVETAGERRAYRDAWSERRCVVPADGFFEWEDVGSGRQPYWLGLEHGVPFAMGGLWERWRAEEGPIIESFTLLTTDASPLVARIHDRMPLVIPQECLEDWLDASRDPEPVVERARAQPPAFISHTVGTHVNDVRHDDPACVTPADPLPRQESLF
jgi:putative SOS response-associated peptidase YedK